MLRIALYTSSAPLPKPKKGILERTEALDSLSNSPLELLTDTRFSFQCQSVSSLVYASPTVFGNLLPKLLYV